MLLNPRVSDVSLGLSRLRSVLTARCIIVTQQLRSVAVFSNRVDSASLSVHACVGFY